jgi:serralysin
MAMPWRCQSARGGDDFLESPGSLRGPIISNSDLFGDAQTLSGTAVGGNDSLYGAVAAEGSISRLFGDGFELLDNARGGNDLLTSRTHRSDIMVGDAFVVSPEAVTGSDIFAFAPGNGRDMIVDFEQGKDRIAFDGFRSLPAFPGTGIDNFEALASRIVEQSDGSLLILDVFGPSGASSDNSVLVVGVFGLSVADFVFI